MKTLFFVLMLVSWILTIIVIGWYLAIKDYAWEIDRSLVECIEETIIRKQESYVNSWKECPICEESTESITTDEFIQDWIISPIDAPIEPVKEEPKEPEIIKEPICLDFLGWGDELKCYKWE